MFAILFLTADPTDAVRLRLGEEMREIQEKLQLAKQRDAFVLHQRPSVRPSDISQALLDLNPKIVHFSGHGTTTGAICVEDEIGKTHPVEPEALADLFEQFTSRVNCVILNACYSEIQAQSIGKHIKYVIGMSQAIGDKAAIAFSGGFYQALGAGRSIEESYRLGCVQIKLLNIPEHLTPVLIKKDSITRELIIATGDLKGPKFDRDQLVLRPYFEPIAEAQPKDALETLMRLIEVGSSTRTILDFFNDNAYLLLKITPRRSLFVVSQLNLGDDHSIDFGLYGEMNTNWWCFMELGEPETFLFNENGDPSADLVQALRQTQDWSGWVRQNTAWTTKYMGPLSPGQIIPVAIMGRRSTLSQEDKKRLEHYSFIYTYDSLIESTKDFLNMKLDALVQKRAIPWNDFKRILQKNRLSSLWHEVELLTGELVYMRQESFMNQFTDVELSSALSVRQQVAHNELGQQAITLCTAFVNNSPITMPKDGKLAQLLLFLYELKTLPWGQAVDVPRQELASFERAAKLWSPQTMAKELCLEALGETLKKTYGPLTNELKAAVRKAVQSVSIPHHTAIRTCEAFALSLLVSGWCSDEANLLSAMVSIYRKGAIVTSSLVIGSDHKNLALSPIVW